MGLFDSVIGAATQAAGGALGQALGGQAGQPSPDLLAGLSGLLGGGSAEGLAGLVRQFQEGGLSDVVASWVSTGQNLPVTADQISQVLGHEGVGRFAQALGIDPKQAAGQLTQWLPQVVDALTPNGQLPPAGQPDLASLLPQLLGGMLRG